MASSLMTRYCRVIQLGYYALAHVMRWREPELLCGEGAMEKLPEHLHKKKLSNVMIVTDEFLAGTEHFKNLLQIFEQSKISYSIYDKTIPNPTIDNIEEAAKIYQASKCDCLLAYGGGSSIDCAKGVGIRIVRPRTPFKMMKGTLKVLRTIPYLIAIPTTAGTGSECTIAAVISDAKTHEKYPVNDFKLMPRLAVLDANITVGLPAQLTATTGMDALTHAIEAYIGNCDFDGSDDAALKAGKLIYKNLQKAYQDGNDIKAREDLQMGAYLAGYAITRGYVGYVHCIAHSLGGLYRTPHGFANAVILPYVLEAYGETIYKRLGDFAMAIGAVPENTKHSEAAVQFIQIIRDMNKSMNIPEHLADIQEEDIEKLAKTASAEGNPFYPVPVVMDAKELGVLYRKVKGAVN